MKCKYEERTGRIGIIVQEGQVRDGEKYELDNKTGNFYWRRGNDCWLKPRNKPNDRYFLYYSKFYELNRALKVRITGYEV